MFSSSQVKPMSKIDGEMAVRNGSYNSEHRVSEDGSTDNQNQLAVLQAERRDYLDLAPAKRQRAHSLEGFDDIYTDIVDYIVRCTHR